MDFGVYVGWGHHTEVNADKEQVGAREERHVTSGTRCRTARHGTARTPPFVFPSVHFSLRSFFPAFVFPCVQAACPVYASLSTPPHTPTP